MNRTSKQERLVEMISHFYNMKKDDAEQLLRIVITATFNLLNENESFQYIFPKTGDFTDQLIKISKQKIKKNKADTQQKMHEIIKSTYEIPSTLIGTRDAARAIGVNRRRIQYLIDSGKVESKKVGYGNQVRVLILKKSLYKLYPKIK